MEYDVPRSASDAGVGSPEDILRRAAAVRDRSGFPTVDQLSAEVESLRAQRPDLISFQRIGASRLGEEIPLYTIGSGRLSVLVVGGVHPNEPIGSWTVVHLMEQLIGDDGYRSQLDVTWHIVPCVDPDGMRLNEGWFADPTDRGRYARNFYRPAPDEQVEWTFPFRYKKADFDAMLPETEALARAIDASEPDLYVALHNSEAGGVYYYLSRPAPGLYDLLHHIPDALGVPLHKGEPESAHFAVLASGIFEMGTLEAAYDWTESLGLDPYPPGSGGNASSAYAQQYGTLSLIAELPYWSDAAADDTSTTDQSYAEVLRRSGDLLVESGTRLLGLLERSDAAWTLNTPFLRGSRVFAPLVRAAGEGNLARAALPESARPATVAESHAVADLVHMYRLRFGGMLVRALKAEIDAGTASAELHRAALDAESLFEEWLLESRADDTSFALPIAALVGVQYGAILSACAYLTETR